MIYAVLSSVIILALFFYTMLYLSIKEMMNRHLVATRSMLNQLSKGEEISPAIIDKAKKGGKVYNKSKDLDALMKGEIVEFWQ